ncbi:MAG TPA: ABC transporter permease [Woeseiaceae bacterium]|nr:ABC transporter permease [Woeseiaceae bacterium]
MILKFLLKRILASLPTLFIVSVFVFLLLRMVPGDPAALVVGDVANSAELARVRAEMGLDKPLPAQYLLWLADVLRGDFGYSFMNREAVLPALMERFQVTVQVIALAFLLSAAVAIPAGVFAAWRQNRRADIAIVTSATLLLSVPSFWMGILLILLFGVKLGWLPTLGFVPFQQSPTEWLLHIIMPTAALVFVETAILTRLMRASTIEVLGQEYITYARSKGLPESIVLRRHTLKNAITPTLTMLGLILGSLLSGTVVIETIFGLPGLGRFLIDAIYARDYPVIQGTLLFIVLIYVAINIVIDLLYPLLDPRVRQA